MKNYGFALVLAFMIASPSFAQVADEEPSDIDQKAKKIATHLTEDLALSEDQREDVYELTVDMLEEKKESKKTRGEIMQEFDEELAEILNDEQYAQYMESDARKKMMMDKKDKERMKEKKHKDGKMKEDKNYRKKEGQRESDRSNEEDGM